VEVLQYINSYLRVDVSIDLYKSPWIFRRERRPRRSVKSSIC